MAIPSYEFYKDVFLGAGIAAEDWDRLATRADEQIMRLERGYTVTDPLGNGRDKPVAIGNPAGRGRLYLRGSRSV